MDIRRFIMTDTHFELICPNCNKKMSKLLLNDYGFNIDICQSCGGIWVDKSEDVCVADSSVLQGVLEKAEISSLDDLQKILFCPACSSLMDKDVIPSTEREIVIDVCKNCGGKFFDYSDLLALKNILADRIPFEYSNPINVEFSHPNENLNNLKFMQEQSVVSLLRVLSRF